MIKAVPWIDEILKDRIFDVTLFRKAQKKYPVKFSQLPDVTDGKKDLETNQKNNLRKFEAEKIYTFLKNIFADHLMPDCIDQLMKLKCCELNAEKSEEYLHKELYDAYRTQRDRFFIIYMDCKLQLLTKKIGMSSELAEKISRLCNKIEHSKKYFVFSKPVKNTVSKCYEWVFETYYLYIWYVHALILIKDPKYNVDNTSAIDVKAGILSMLNGSIERKCFINVCPDINWTELPVYLQPDTPQTQNVVEHIYAMLERDANRIMENDSVVSNEDILFEKLNDLLAFYNEVNEQRMNKDKDFADFDRSFKKAVTVLNRSLENSDHKDSDRQIEEIQGAVPDDFMATQELNFLKRLYGLIYDNLLPVEDFQWYDIDGKIVDKICTYIEELAEYNTIYRYVNANYATLWDVIEDIENRLKYPVAHHISQMIERMNLGMDTYHAIYKKSSSNNMEQSDLIDFENRLEKVYSYFRTNLGEVYDSVLEDDSAAVDFETMLLERDPAVSENE